MVMVMEHRGWIPKHLLEKPKQMHNLMQRALDGEWIPHIQLEIHWHKKRKHENEVYKGKTERTVNVVMNLRHSSYAFINASNKMI